MIHLKNVAFHGEQLLPKLKIGWAVGQITRELHQDDIEDIPASAVFTITLEGALSGDKDDFYTLGTMYEFGAVFLHKIENNEVLQIFAEPITAKLLFSEAENRGHADASFRLGLIEHNGILGPADLELAAEHFAKGALSGHSICCRMLGIYSHNENNPSGAREWFLRGAELGDPISSFNTAKAIQRGELAAYTIEDAVRFSGDAASKLPDDEEIQTLFRQLSLCESRLSGDGLMSET